MSNENYHYLATITPEEKCRLYNECEFLISNNYAKLNYISEKGFGKALWRLITGEGKKAKKKILENTIDLQAKMKDILVYLEEDMLNVKLRVMHQSHSLILLHMYYLRFTALLEDISNHTAHIDEFLAEKYPDYQKWDTTRTQAELEFLKANINAQIIEMNRQDEEYYNRFKKEENRIDKARSARILKITPFEATVVTKKGIEEIIPISGEDGFKYTVRSETVRNWLDKKECNVAVLPADMEGKPGGIKVIPPADYFMYLWFLNTPMEERKGHCVYAGRLRSILISVYL